MARDTETADTTGHKPPTTTPPPQAPPAEGDIVTVTNARGTVVHTRPEVAQRLRRRDYS